VDQPGVLVTAAATRDTGAVRFAKIATLLTAVVLAGAAAAPHAAGAAGRWQRFGGGGNISDQVGLARTPDGVLHVAWRRRRGRVQDLLQTSIAPSGKVGATTTIATGWASIGSPALVANGSQLAAFFPGTQTLITGDPTEGLDLATSADGGRTWTLAPAAIARNNFAASRTPAAIISQRGNWVQSWYNVDQTVVHTGLDGGVPAVSGYGMGTDQALAATNFNQVMVAWCTELQAQTGVFLARVDPVTGARVGAVVHVPDSGRCPADTRVALVGGVAEPDSYLVGSLAPALQDFFVATSSASGRIVRVHELHAGQINWSSTVARGSSFKQQIMLATERRLNGLWSGWRDSDSGEMVIRHLPSGIDWAPKISVPLPVGQSLSQLASDANQNRLEVIATGSDANNLVSLYATQVLPALRLTGGRKQITVLEAVDGVSGATVRVAGRTLTSGSYGRARLKPALARGTYTARASKPGYTGATLRFRVP
jgi:hypothetical protein